MAGFIDEFMRSYGPEVTRQLSSSFNVDQNTAQKLVPTLAPLILSGLKVQKDTMGGDERVDHILNKYGDASVLNNINDLISSKSQASTVDPNLGGLLGANGGFQAAQTLAKSLNIDASTIMKMIPALAPLLLGALSRKRDTSGAGIKGIGSLLDADGDGSILDDVAGYLMKGGSAQNRTSRTGSKGILGTLLGGLTRRR
jgi:hypothetical protein